MLPTGSIYQDDDVIPGQCTDRDGITTIAIHGRLHGLARPGTSESHGIASCRAARWRRDRYLASIRATNRYLTGIRNRGRLTVQSKRHIQGTAVTGQIGGDQLDDI